MTTTEDIAESATYHKSHHDDDMRSHLTIIMSFINVIITHFLINPHYYVSKIVHYHALHNFIPHHVNH